MRLSVLFSVICSFHLLAGNSYSQNARLSLGLQQVTVDQVLSEIEQKSEFYFLYNHKLIDVERKVNTYADKQLIKDILDGLFANTNVDYVVIDRQIVLSPSEYLAGTKAKLQPLIITGTVTDENGEPLPGVSILIKGTTGGTVTNLEGVYTIEVNDRTTTLVFSYVGYITQEITVGDQTVINVTMAVDFLGLDEVVVIGYGTARKSDLTGAVTRANIEAFREQPNVSILQSLQGTIPGLNVGQVDRSGENPSLSIRGRTTISGEQRPLIVIDGVIFRGDLIDLNSTDIESIDILKDASSTAIYGSQATNGVILVTTKSGFRGKPRISYSNQTTLSQPTKILEPLNMEGRLKRIYDADWRRSRLGPDYLTPNPDWDYSIGFDYSEITDGYAKGVNTDWLDLLTQNSRMQNHSIDLTGGTEKMSYYTSFGFTDQKGWIINDDYQRYTLRINLDNKITDWATIGIQSFMTISDYSGYSPSVVDIYTDPLAAPYDENGELVLYPNGNRLNPMFRETIDDLDKRLNLFGNVYAQIKVPFIEGLSLKITYNNNYIHNKDYRFNKYGYNLNGTGYKNHLLGNDWTLDNLINYERFFGENHKVNATVVYGRESRQFEETLASSSLFTNMKLGYYSLQSGDVIQQTTTTGGWEENSLYSMGRLFYSYSNKYLITGTLRRDGFSGFGENNKFGVFPSIAIAWIPTLESFFPEVGWLNYLKLRFSYGTNGNRTVQRYGTLARVDQAYAYVYGDAGSPVLGQTISLLPNPDLQWETTTGSNYGIDYTFLNSRLFGNVDFYISRTNNLLYNINIPEMTGFSSINTNIGELKNHGLEMSLKTVNVRNQNWEWLTTLNFSFNRNEVVTILGRDDDGDGKEDDLIASNIFIGEPLGLLYGYEVTGMYQIGDSIPNGFYPGSYSLLDIDQDGNITPDKDRKILGYSDPAYSASIQNYLKYKKWTLNVLFITIQGGKNYYYEFAGPRHDYKWSSSVLGATTKDNTPAFDWWTPENPDAKYETLGTKQTLQGQVPQQRSFVRLQDISLAYKFDTKFGLAGKVFLSGKNLITWTKWEGVDPETGVGFQPGFPVMKSYTIGFNVEF